MLHQEKLEGHFFCGPGYELEVSEVIAIVDIMINAISHWLAWRLKLISGKWKLKFHTWNETKSCQNNVWIVITHRKQTTVLQLALVEGERKTRKAQDSPSPQAVYFQWLSRMSTPRSDRLWTNLKTFHQIEILFKIFVVASSIMSIWSLHVMLGPVLCLKIKVYTIAKFRADILFFHNFMKLWSCFKPSKKKSCSS